MGIRKDTTGTDGLVKYPEPEQPAGDWAKEQKEQRRRAIIRWLFWLFRIPG